MEPLVSVIIPVYNVRRYLCESVKSVLRQTYRNFEILLIDDGSDDGSGALCDRLGSRDSRIRVIHRENGGLSAARNTGLAAMTGALVAFLDSDDAYTPDFLRVMVAALTQSGADIAVCRYAICRTDGHMSPAHGECDFFITDETVSGGEALRRLIGRRINQSVWNKLYRAELFAGLRFPEGICYEDMVLEPYLFARAHSVRTVRSTLVCYRKHPGSITAGTSAKKVRDLLYAGQDRLRFVAAHTPEVFDAGAQVRTEQDNFRGLIVHWLNAIPLCDRRAAAMLRRAIRQQRANLPAFSAGTKLLYYLFLVSPRLCRAWRSACIAAACRLRRLRERAGAE